MSKMSRVVGMVVLFVCLVSAANADVVFLSHYNQNTNADYALGNAVATSQGGVIVPTSKFGSGSLDTTLNGPAHVYGNLTQYETANNFNVHAGTIDMWIKTDSWADSKDEVFWSSWNFTYGWWGGIWLKKNANNQLIVEFNEWDYWDMKTAPLSLDNEWHHIAWDWDLAAGQSYLYVDGIVQAVTMGGNQGINEWNGIVDQAFEVGTRQGGWEAFEGYIDELRITNSMEYGGQSFNVPTAEYIPEPATLILLAIGGLALRTRKL